jgi:hypothetical protein
MRRHSVDYTAGPDDIDAASFGPKLFRATLREGQGIDRTGKSVNPGAEKFIKQDIAT